MRLLRAEDRAAAASEGHAQGGSSNGISPAAARATPGGSSNGISPAAARAMPGGSSNGGALTLSG
eukprot:305673-Prymnesium_polylepis.1